MMMLGLLASTPAWGDEPGGDGKKTDPYRPETGGTEAGQDFAQGQKAFAAGDYRGAAGSFEEAYRKKPHHASLWNAGRSWQRAGEHARAANVYLHYLAEAPVDARDRDHATEALRDLAATLGRLDIQGAEVDIKTVRVDGSNESPNSTASGTASVFVNPGEHVVEGRLRAGGGARRNVNVSAGQILSVALVAGDPSSSSSSTATTPSRNGTGQDASSSSRSFHLPWVVVAVGGALTLVSGGLLMWSGIDTLDKRDAFLDAPTHEKLADGKDRQLRTNILVATTAGLGALTGVAALFVDWKGNGANRGGVRVSPLLIANGGGGLVLSGSAP